MSKKMLSLVVLAGLTSTLLVGCPWLLKYVLTVQNFTGEEITALYLKSANAGSWGSNQLTSAIPGDGSPFQVQDIPTGVYDLKATFTTPSIARFNVPFSNDWLWLFSAIDVGEGEYTAVQIIDTLVAQ